MSPEEEYRRIKQTVKNINKYMKSIGEKLEIEKKSPPIRQDIRSQLF